MKIGFIGFGEVAYTLSMGLLDSGAIVYTCLEGRSHSTKNRAQKVGVRLCTDYKELSETSQIIISAVIPSLAVEVAKSVGKYSKGIYVDINNVSPKTVKEALTYVENNKTVDAAIIGSVKRNGPKVQIIACGDYAEDFAILNDYGLNIEIKGHEVGDCSQIKMLRSAYTKGVSALLWETLSASYKMGIDKEVLEIISQTEGPQFKDSTNSRLLSSFKHAKRRYEEMDEVKSILSDEIDPVMVEAIEKTFECIYLQNSAFCKNSEIKDFDKDPIADLKDYKSLFKILYDK